VLYQFSYACKLDGIEYTIKGNMADTFAESRLRPLGFEVVERHETRNHAVDAVTMRLGETVVNFECVCPAYPNARGLGCSLHHDDHDPGDSWPVFRAEQLALSAESL